MKEIFRWNDDVCRHPSDYKKSKQVLKFLGDYGRFKNRINKSNTLFMSEAMDNYRPFQYKQDKLMSTIPFVEQSEEEELVKKQEGEFEVPHIVNYLEFEND